MRIRRHSTGVDRRARPYPAPVLECVPNVSEGRDRDVLDALARRVRRRAARPCTSTPTTTARCSPWRATAPLDAVRRAGSRPWRDASTSRAHAGVHPRLGALDVVPFVALDGSAAAARGRRGARLRGVGRRRARASRCSSTTTPTRSAARCPTRAATRSVTRARPRAGAPAPDARRGRGRCAPAAGRGQLRARHRRRRRSRARIAARRARARRRAPRRARARAAPRRRSGARRCR